MYLDSEKLSKLIKRIIPFYYSSDLMEQDRINFKDKIKTILKPEIDIISS